MLEIRTTARQGESNSQRCPYCLSAVSHSDVIVTCGDCGAIHHHECWLEPMRCSACSSTKMLLRDQDRLIVENAATIVKLAGQDLRKIELRVQELEKLAKRSPSQAKTFAPDLFNLVSQINDPDLAEELKNRVRNVMDKIEPNFYRNATMTPEQVELEALINPPNELKIAALIYFLIMFIVFVSSSNQENGVDYLATTIVFLCSSIQLLIYGICAKNIPAEQPRTTERLLAFVVFCFSAAMSLAFMFGVLSVNT